MVKRGEKTICTVRNAEEIKGIKVFLHEGGGIHTEKNEWMIYRDSKINYGLCGGLQGLWVVPICS
jgi:hypothetical protein